MRYLFSVVFALLTINAFSQGKKIVEKYGVRSCTEVSSKIEDGKTIEEKEFTSFDARGNKTEKSLTINNQLEEKDTYKYDKKNNEIEHVEYKKDGSIKKKIIMKLIVR